MKRWITIVLAWILVALVLVAAGRLLAECLDVLDLAASGMFDEPLWGGLA